MHKIILLLVTGFFISPSVSVLAANGQSGLLQPQYHPAKVNLKTFKEEPLKSKRPDNLSKKLTLAKDCVINAIGFFYNIHQTYKIINAWDPQAKKDISPLTKTEALLISVLPTLCNGIYDSMQSIGNYKNINKKEQLFLGQNKIKFATRIVINVLPLIKTVATISHVIKDRKCNEYFQHALGIVAPALISINSLVKTFQTYTFKKAPVTITPILQKPVNTH